MRELAVAVVTLLLSGSLYAGLASLRQSKSLARKTNAEAEAVAKKVDVEVDAVAVQGSNNAVLSLERSLAAAERRAETAEGKVVLLEAEREADRATIAQLQQQVAELQNKAERAVRHAAEAREDARLLQERLGQMAHQYDQRHPHQS